MWAAIAKAISEATSETFELTTKRQVSGGDINLAYIISNGISNGHRAINEQANKKPTKQYFVKINRKSNLALLETEQENLNKIRQLSTIHCPVPITLGTTLDNSFLVLSFELLTSPKNDHWYDLGVTLADMHLCSQHGQFGWHQDNYIGQTLQPNRWQTNWRTFFAEQRIGWQLQLLKEQAVSLGDIEKITTVCHDLLVHHKVTPCLVHGDLWQGNVGFANGKPLIYDPACYFGDREVDIAMSELFGKFPAPFYQGYEHTYPLTGGYEQRKLVYNFYHLLNHLLMFGEPYLKQAQEQLELLLNLNELSQ